MAEVGMPFDLVGIATSQTPCNATCGVPVHVQLRLSGVEIS